MPEAKNPEDFAIVIGINHYPQIQPMLQAAEDDALRFADWLADPDGGGLDPSNIHLLTGKKFTEDNLRGGPLRFQPHKFTVDDELQAMHVDQKKRIGRRLYFYFSGHGAGVGPNDVAMLLANAAEERMETCHIGLTGYRDWFHDAAPFDELIFILDCCRNRANMAQTLRPVFPHFLDEQRFRKVKPLTMLATLDGDEAFEGVEAAVSAAAAARRRGLLTQALMEGLEHKQAADSTGAITAVSLAAWLKRRVPELATVKNVEQQAKVPDPPENMVVVPPSAVAPPVQAPAAQGVPLITFSIVIPPGLAGPLRLTRGSAPDQTEEHDPNVSPWIFMGPRTDLYLIEHPASGRMLSIRPADIKEETHEAAI
ncbi:MAG TPA: caspase family protein [Thermoanaerobaculia bacterium]|jgi:uncharacterized caspase-like protein|nr:caspase family protein [Thermoanaerobaculia bacterium]